MKRFNFLLVAIALVLTITAVSCTTMAGTQDDYYGHRVYGDRVYVEDPYRGTIVLERDPWSGRYYETSPYYNGYYGGSYYGRVPRVYGHSYPSGRRNNDGYSNRNNRNDNARDDKDRNNQRPSDNDRRTKDEARQKILGSH